MMIDAKFAWSNCHLDSPLDHDVVSDIKHYVSHLFDMYSTKTPLSVSYRFRKIAMDDVTSGDVSDRA